MLDPINDKLKKSIEQHNISWDKEAMWLDIEPQLPKKSNKRWLLILLLFLILATVVGTYVYPKSKVKSEQPMATIDMESINSIGTNANKSENTSEPIISTIEQIQLNKIEDTKNIAVLNTKKATSQSIKKSNNRQKPEVTQKPNVIKNGAILANHAKMEQSDKSLVAIDKKPTNAHPTINKEATLSKNNRKVAALQGLKNSNNLLIDKNTLQLDLVPVIVKTITPQKSLPSTLSLMAGAFVFDKKYTVTSELGKELNETYTPLEAINLSLAYNKLISDKWSIGSGLEVQYDVEKFDFTSIKSTIQTIAIDTAYFFVEDDAKVFIAGNRDQVTTVSRNVISYNTRLTLGVPLYLSYQILSNKSSLSIMGGPIAHVIALEQGNNVESTSSIVDIDTKAFDFSTLTYSFDLSLVYSYKLKNNLKLVVSPSLRRQINTSIDASNISFQRNFVGLKAGILWAI